MNTLREEIGVKAWTNYRRFECFHGVDDRLDEGKRLGAMRFNGDFAQIEAGLLGIALGIDVIGRVAPNGNVAWHVGQNRRA